MTEESLDKYETEDAQWHRERDILIENLQKQQKLVAQAQHSWAKEKENLESHHRQVEQRLQQENLQLRKDLALLKTKVEQPSKPGASLQLELLRELERLDFVVQDKEADMSREILALKSQLNQVHSAATENSSRVQEEKRLLQDQLEVAKGEVHELEQQHQKATKELANKLAKTTKELDWKTQELDRLKIEYEAKLKTLMAQKSVGGDSDQHGLLSGSARFAGHLQRVQESTAPMGAPSGRRTALTANNNTPT